MRASLVGAVGLAVASLLAGNAVAQTATVPPPAGAVGETGVAPARTEMQELIAMARATAQASRESVDYGRVVPDLLTQILAKLDKIEDKLDKIETGQKGMARRTSR